MLSACKKLKAFYLEISEMPRQTGDDAAEGTAVQPSYRLHHEFLLIRAFETFFGNAPPYIKMNPDEQREQIPH
jgi:hypothetical protein